MDYKYLNCSLYDNSNNKFNYLEYKSLINKNNIIHIYNWIYKLNSESSKIIQFSYSNIFDVLANIKIFFC